MKVAVVFFGPARQVARTERTDVELHCDATVEDLRAEVVRRFPALRDGAAAMRFAVNDTFAPADKRLEAGDEVAVIPPVSGGADASHGDLIALTDSPLDHEQVRAHLANAPSGQQGGICTFEGRTRSQRHDKHGPLVELQYEAHDAMAIKELRTLAERARRQWSIGSLAILHRIGKVPIGEPSVMIAVACEHRGDAFSACRWLIDMLKREVPIWKKEIWLSGESNWVDPTKATG